MDSPIAKFELEPGVRVTVYPETDPDWSWVDDEASESCNALFKRKIRNGDVSQVIVVVSVVDSSGEVEGSDVLGGIVIGIDDHKQEIRDSIEANDMVDEARADLKRKLDKIISANRIT